MIVTGGPLPDEAASVISKISGSAEDSVIISCDGGTDFLASHGIIPDMVVGDLDSITENGLEYIRANNIFVEKYPVEKDATDTEIAIGKTGNDRTVLVCPVSGRIDHVLSNFQIVLKQRSLGKNIVLTDGMTYCYPLTGEDRVEIDVSSYGENAAVSLVPWDFGCAVTGVTTEGLYYPLENASLSAGSSFSFSNHPASKASKIGVSIRSGMLMVVVTNAN